MASAIISIALDDNSIVETRATRKLWRNSFVV
jgi:hypothetical protein